MVSAATSEGKNRQNYLWLHALFRGISTGIADDVRAARDLLPLTKDFSSIVSDRNIGIMNGNFYMWNRNVLLIAACLAVATANSADAKPKPQYVFKFFSLNPVHYVYSKYSKNITLNGLRAKDIRYFYRDPSAADRNYDTREVWEYEVSSFKCATGEGTWVTPDGSTKYTFSTIEPLAIMGQIFETCKTIYSHSKIRTKDSPRYSEIWTSDLGSLPFGLIVKFNSFGNEDSQVPYNSEELREFKIPKSKP